MTTWPRNSLAIRLGGMRLFSLVASLATGIMGGYVADEYLTKWLAAGAWVTKIFMWLASC